MSNVKVQMVDRLIEFETPYSFITANTSYGHRGFFCSVPNKKLRKELKALPGVIEERYNSNGRPGLLFRCSMYKMRKSWFGGPYILEYEPTLDHEWREIPLCNRYEAHDKSHRVRHKSGHEITPREGDGAYAIRYSSNRRTTFSWQRIHELINR